MIKVLIVEDEPILRQGIVSLVEWDQINCEICGSCSNGVEAVNFIKENHVDLVISDIKMPGMDGLELAKHVKSHYSHIFFILLTAYTEFEYAQAAIHLGADDYVLKKDFILTLPKIVKTLFERKSASGLISNVGNRLFHDSIKLSRLALRGILDGSIRNESEIAAIVSQYGLHLESYYIMLIEINGLSRSEAKSKELAAVQSILHLFDSVLKEWAHFHVTMSPSEIYIIIGTNNPKESDGTIYLNKICNNTINMLAEYTVYGITIGISQNHTNILEIKAVAEEAKVAASQIWEENQIKMFQEQSVANSSSKPINLYNTCERIFACIAKSDSKELIEYISSLFKEYSVNATLAKLRLDITFLISLCCKKLEEYNVEQEICEHIRIEASEEIAKKSTPYGIKISFQQTVLNIMEIVDKQYFKGSNRLILQVDTFIKENYALPIKLDDIANFLHVNSSYLSRLYKKETGKSLVTALNQYRIEKAKGLLSSGKYLVSEVGAMVGIDDPAYFTKIFTKFTGLNPKKVLSGVNRNKAQKNEQEM